MNLNCNCEDQLDSYLCDIPKEWRSSIIKVICNAIATMKDIECKDLKKCETLTSLSAITVEGCDISMTFTAENKVSYKRSFNYCNLINSLMNNVDPNCLSSIEDWNSLSHIERIQLIIDKINDRGCCCECAILDIQNIGGGNVITEIFVDDELLDLPYPVVNGNPAVQIPIQTGTYTFKFTVTSHNLNPLIGISNSLAGGKCVQVIAPGEYIIEDMNITCGTNYIRSAIGTCQPTP